MSKKPISGSYALIESLLNEGVDTIFGYPGGAIIPVFDALYDYYERIRKSDQQSAESVSTFSSVTEKRMYCYTEANESTVHSAGVSGKM